MTRCEYCGGEFAPKRPHARFCSDACRSVVWKQNSSEKLAERVPEHPLAEVRDLQETHKDRWSAIVREAIIDTLRNHPIFHADSLEPLGIPDEHRSIIGSQVAKLVNQRWIEEVERRKSTLPSRNGAKSGVYSLTALGRTKLVELGTGVSMPQGSEGSTAPSRASANTDEAAPRDLGIGVSGAPIPLPDQRGRDRQVRDAGSTVSGLKSRPRQPMPPDVRRNTQPVRLFDPAEARERPLSAFRDAEAA